MFDMLYDQSGQPDAGRIALAAGGLDRMKAVLTAMEKGLRPDVACSKYGVRPDLLETVLHDPLFQSAPMQRPSRNPDKALAAAIFEVAEEDLGIPDGRLAFTIPKVIDSLPDKEACAILRVFYMNGAPSGAKSSVLAYRNVMTGTEQSSALQRAMELLRHPQRKNYIATGASLSHMGPDGPAMSRRLANILARNDILVLADLERMTRLQASAMKGVGRKTLNELQQLLTNNGTAFMGQERPAGKADA